MTPKTQPPAGAPNSAEALTLNTRPFDATAVTRLDLTGATSPELTATRFCIVAVGTLMAYPLALTRPIGL
jgi:hypothetical protein